MNIQKKDYVLAGIIFLTCLLVLEILFPGWLTAPNQLLISDHGDALRNLFVFSWFLEYESMGLQVSGVNYPWGESLIFLDGQPFFATLFRPFFPGDWGVGLAQLLLAFSFALAGSLTFLISREFKMGRLAAVLLSLTLLILSPQVERFTNHTTLSYLSCLPGVWWLCIQIAKRKKRARWISVLIVHNAIWFFIHPYLGLMTVAFSGIFILITILRDLFAYQWKWSSLIGLLAPTLIPLAIFRVVLTLVDQAPNRPALANGFLKQLATLPGLLIPQNGPVHDFWAGHFDLSNSLSSEQWEGLGYPGMLQIVLGLIGIILGLVFFFRKRKEPDQPGESSLMTISLLSGGLFLAISMGFPFLQFPEIAHWFPEIRQFRFLGRFNWMSFWVLGVFAWRWADWLAKKLNVLGWALLLIFALINIFESQPHLQFLKANLFKSKNPFTLAGNGYQDSPWNLENLPGQINPEEYQSVIPIPFFYTGTETFQVPYFAEIQQSSYAFAYQTGLPLHALSGGRSSISRGNQQMQLFAPTWFPKQLADSIQDPRPVLLLTLPSLPMNEDEKSLIRRAEPLLQAEQISLFSISRDSLFAFSHKPANHDSLVWRKGFEDKVSEFSYQGNGAFSGWIGHYSILFDSQADSLRLDPEKKYRLSFWYRNRDEGAFRMGIAMEQFDENGEYLGYDGRSEGHNSRRFEGDWVQMNFDFEVKPETQQLKWFIHGEEDLQTTIYFDEVEIWELED